MTDRADHLAERAAALLRAGELAPVPYPEEGGARLAAPFIPPSRADIRIRTEPSGVEAASRRESGRKNRPLSPDVDTGGEPAGLTGFAAMRRKPATMTWARRGFTLAVAVVPWAYLTSVVWAQAAGGGTGLATDTGAGAAAGTGSSGLRSVLERLLPGQPAAGSGPAWTFDGALSVQAGAINTSYGSGRDSWSFVGVVQPEFNLTGDTRRLSVRLYYSPVLSVYSNGGGTQIGHYLNGIATAAVVPDWLYLDVRAYASDLPRYGGFYYGGFGYGTSAFGSGAITPLLNRNTSVQSATASVSPYAVHTFDGWGTARIGYALQRTWLGNNDAINAFGTTTVAPGVVTTNALPGFGTIGDLTTQREFASFITGENFNRFNNDLEIVADQYSGGGSLYQGSSDFLATNTVSYAVNRWLAALGSVGYEQIKYGGVSGFRGDFVNWTVGVRLTPNPDSSITVQYGRKEGDYTWLANGYYTPTPRLAFYGSYNSAITTYLQRLQAATQTSVVGPSGVLVDQRTGVPVTVVSPFGIYNGVSRVKTLTVGASYLLNRDAFSVSVNHEENQSLSSSSSLIGTTLPAGAKGTATAGSISWQHDINPATYLTTTFTYGVSDNGVFLGNVGGGSTNSWIAATQLLHQFTSTLSGTASFSHAEQSGASGSAAAFLNTSQNLFLLGLRKTFLNGGSVYEAFYKLSGMPFQLTPDSRFFFGSRGHSKAIAHLNYGLAQGEGFIIITGEVGAGKTTLVEWLRSQMDPNAYSIARVNTTQVSENDLFRLAMAGFGLVDDSPGKATLLQRFEGVLRAHQAAGRRCLLIVDEAQNLSLAALEELRMLSNITVEHQTSVQTILLGQPQFRRLLASKNLDQLRQRVLTSYHLGPLSQEETRAYIEHRLQAVGWVDDPEWHDEAFAAVYAHTGGIPRQINRLCSRVLLYGVLEQSHVITAEMVDNTAAELAQDLEGARGEAAVDGAEPAVRDPAALPAAGTTDPQLTAMSMDLLTRVEALEHQMARREQVFRRLSQMLGVQG